MNIDSDFPTSFDFDPKEIAAALLGTWCFPVANEISGVGLLHFTDAGRAVQFVFEAEKSRKVDPMRLWYSVESSVDLRFRPKPDHEGWLRCYRLEGDSLTISADSRVWVCRRPTADEIPDWFAESLESALLGC